MNESTRAFTTALDCNHPAKNHESDDTCWECTMKIIELTKDAENRAEAAEARAAQLQAERDALDAKLSAAMDENAYLRRNLEVARQQAVIDYRRRESAFNEYMAETPLGHFYDDMAGDAE